MMHTTIRVIGFNAFSFFETSLTYNVFVFIEEGIYMEVNIAMGMIVLSFLCFVSSYYPDRHGQLGYKGILFLVSNQKDRPFVYKYSNRSFGATMYIGSLIFLILFTLLDKQMINSVTMHTIRIAYLVYGLSSMLVAELVVIDRKRKIVKSFN